MTKKVMGLKQYLSHTNTKQRKLKKRHSRSVTGGTVEDNVSESVLLELLGGSLPGTYTANVLSHVPNVAEEEQEQKGNKIDIARQLFQSLINQPNLSRKDIIQKFVDDIGVTHSTSVSYYERLAKEAGITNASDKEAIGTPNNDSSAINNNRRQPAAAQRPTYDPELELNDQIDNSDDSERTGIIRTVERAHLIYKRQNNEGKFDELWIYNIGSRVNDELDIRRDILSGTDIPPKKTKSPDGTQTYTLSSMGNAQYMYITGLTN